MPSLQTLIIDDERLARDEMRRLLADTDAVESIAPLAAFVEGDPAAILVVEFYGETPQAVAAEAEEPPTLTEDDQVFVKDGRRCWFVQLSDVRLFEAAGNYTRLYFGHEEPLIHRSLSYLEDRLDPDQFFRASRQHILNLAWVEDVTPWSKNKLKASLSDGTEVELSRRRSRAFRDELSL